MTAPTTQVTPGQQPHADGSRFCLECAATWAVDQPGWIPRVLRGHVERPKGSGVCAACSGYRSVRWPCVLRAIADRGQLLRKQMRTKQQGAAESSGVAA